MVEFFIAPLAIFGLFIVWIIIQFSARDLAQRTPELGPYREEGSGCGGGACHNCTSANPCDRNEAST